MTSTAAQLTRAVWIKELTQILIEENLIFPEEAARGYAEDLWPSEQDIEEWWDGELPTPREALKSDMEYWEL